MDEPLIDQPSQLGRRIGLLGYGEVGRILAEDLRRQQLEVSAYDIACTDTMRIHAERRGVRLYASPLALAGDSDLLICAVTPSQALEAARICAAGLRRGTFFLDLNGISPGARRQASVRIGAVGAHYVEGAMMSAIPPYRLRVPLLLGGQQAAALAPWLNQIGFVSKVFGTEVGAASMVRMCRSTIMLGLEAMVVESFTTARAYGVEDALLASLLETFPGVDWERQGTQFFRRAIAHGGRRAEELQEVMQAMADTGMGAHSAAGAAEAQAWMAAMADQGIFKEDEGIRYARLEDWRFEADRILEHQSRERDPRRRQTVAPPIQGDGALRTK